QPRSSLHKHLGNLICAVVALRAPKSGKAPEVPGSKNSINGSHRKNQKNETKSKDHWSGQSNGTPKKSSSGFSLQPLQ
ncbi:4102_t:CDS:2, partial [Funneliformis geosporum]